MDRLPGVYPELQDGGLGAVAPSGEGLRAIVGVSSAGEVNTPLALSDPGRVSALLGTGPLASAVADQLALGGGVVYACRAESSIAGSVTPDATNPPEPAVTVTGEPLDSYALVVRIVTAGEVGTAAFTYSLDGGDTVSRPIATASSYDLPGTGLTLAFAPGSYTVGQIYRFDAAAPQASVADVQEAVQALLEANLLYEYIHLAQPSDNAMWAALESLALQAENDFRYIHFLAEAEPPGDDPDAWVNTLLAQIDGFEGRKVQVVSTYVEAIDTLTGRSMIRNAASRIGARMSRGRVNENPGWVQRGPLPGVITAAPFARTDFGKKPLYNNGHALALDQAGFTALHTIPGRSGYFVVDGTMAASPTSDYRTVMNVRVMHKAVTQVRMALLDFVQQGVDPVDLEASLADLVARGNAPLRLMRGRGEIARGRVVIPPGQDILASKRLTVRVRIVPFGFLREIGLDIGFENPFLAAAA